MPPSLPLLTVSAVALLLAAAVSPATAHSAALGEQQLSEPATTDYYDEFITQQGRRKLRLASRWWSAPAAASAGDGSGRGKGEVSGNGSVSHRGAAPAEWDSHSTTQAQRRSSVVTGDGAWCGGLPDSWRISVPARSSSPSPRSLLSVLPGEQQRLSPTASWQRRRRLQGFTTMGAGCGKAKQYRVPHENDGAGPQVRKNPKASERSLIECIKDIKKCDANAKSAALNLPGVRLLNSHRGRLRVSGLRQRYNSCAMVGNAGHLSQRAYGKYIDAHEEVVRFNVQKTFEFASYVGNKTALRVVNHRRSLAMCCRGNWPEAKAGQQDSGMMIWFPAAQQEILGECAKRYPHNPRMALSMGVIKTEVQAMSMMRRDLQRLGFGPFGPWRQMTSGSHAVLLFSTLCDNLSLFGFTTYGSQSAGGADQYSAAILKQEGVGHTKMGATAKARSGVKWHDWNGEKLVFRLLHAAGLANICSM